MYAIRSYYGRLSDNIAENIYRPIEYVLIGGIVLGVLLMFQPWVFQLFRVGFFMLLLATIGYILWSHVRPGAATEPEELARKELAGKTE